MKKVLLVGAVFVLMSESAWAEVIDSGQCGDDCTWTYDDETKTIKIDGSGKMNDYGYTMINQNSFYTNAEWQKYEQDTKNIVIKGIENIGRGSFISFNNVENVTIDNTVTTIGESAFSRMTNLNKLVIPDSVTSIGQYAIDMIANLQELVIPDSTTTDFNTFQGTSLANTTVICSGGSDTAKCDAILARAGKTVQSLPAYMKDENGNIVATYGYDNNGKQYLLTADGKLSLKNADGSSYIYNKEGKLTSIRGKKIYTVEEAEAVTAHGDKFHVSLTYK